jgi:hypothetical protein
MSNSTIALKIAKWCFGVVALWYALVCLYTLNDTQIWVDDGTYTMWGIRMGIMMASGFLYVFTELLDRSGE